MSNVDSDPAELTCRDQPSVVADPLQPVVEVLGAREVPLGGPRAMTVRRTLPQRKRSLVGAWCFADHYGPGDVSTGGRMSMGAHPHSGLQTVSWLFSGEIEHRDSLGTHSLIRPGELNLMTGGHGICHSEVSTPRTTTLHGVQLWVALPGEHRNTARDFQHYAPRPVDLGGSSARVFIGTLGSDGSPVRTFTPLLGAEITLGPRAHLELDVDPGFEHGILLDTGLVAVADTDLEPGELGYVGVGVATLELANPSESPSRILILGGAPFTEEIVMWWNFVARSHEEIVAFRDAWQNESAQFGRIESYEGGPPRLPAPALPNARIVPRHHPSS
jgi:redox-sensitive bicupin YhaK (pirin superfamily)